MCKWQVEINEFCRKVLAKHWPDVRRHDDVRTFPPKDNTDEFRVDVICGGFPCQDISVAGKGAGIEGERSGLWSEYARIVRVLRPRYVVVENSPALLGRGLGRVLGDLASCGYDAEWDCLPAAAFGAHHLRDRVYIVAYPNADGERREEQHVPALAARAGLADRAHHANRPRVYPDSFEAWELQDWQNWQAERGVPESVGRLGGTWKPWGVEPGIRRVADGVPHRVDRLRGVGNAVVPVIPYCIGRRLIEANNTKEDTTNV